MPISAAALPSGLVQSLTVYPACALHVAFGANLGDALGCAEAMQPEDIYRLAPDMAACALPVVAHGAGLRIGPDAQLGRPGAALHLDACLTFMTPNAETTEVLTLVETTASGHVAQVFALPLGTLLPGRDYALIDMDRSAAQSAFLRSRCATFTRGTRITLAGGAQMPVEDLHPGARILTRDDGPQPLRWSGQHTSRASGPLAPVRITAGALHNDRDLVISPEHRLFIYQRRDRIGAGRPDLLVRARHLINGTTVRQEPGGHVDYVQLRFDTHQIIYADGIATESTWLPPEAGGLVLGELGAGDLLTEDRPAPQPVQQERHP